MFNSFDFIGKRKLWFGFSGLLIILSVVSIILFRFNWGIDFTGGTILELAFPKNVTVEEVRDGLRVDGLETATIQLSGSNMQGESGDDVIIRTRNLSAEEAQTVVSHVKDKVGEAEVKRIETVGAVIGSEVRHWIWSCSSLPYVIRNASRISSAGTVRTSSTMRQHISTCPSWRSVPMRRSRIMSSEPCVPHRQRTSTVWRNSY